MAKITAKAIVQSRLTQGVGESESVLVSFQADYADGRNKEWAKYTPWLEFKMQMKPEVAALFPNQKSFTVTFDDGEPEVSDDADSLLLEGGPVQIGEVTGTNKL